MAEWLSDNRAVFALVTIIGLLVAFVWSIQIGVKQTRLRARDEVFGDPERTKGGWYWAVCGMSALLLVWFYYRGERRGLSFRTRQTNSARWRRSMNRWHRSAPRCQSAPAI